MLANGRTLSQTEYDELYDVIGDSYGNGDGSGNTFSLPNLTGGGMPATLYGAGSLAPVAGDFDGSQKFLTGDGSSSGAILSGFGVNFIIKYAEDPIFNIFNGAPNQVRHRMGGKYSQQVCIGEDSAGNGVSLSSAGFITMSLSGKVRDPSSNETFNRFAIPVYSY